MNTLPPSASDAISFGPFRLYSLARRLEKNGKTVKIGSRALDILIALLERPGKPVRNNDLVERVWRGMLVEQSSLRVNIAGLRRTLGEGHDSNHYIANIPGQGYCFVAPVAYEGGTAPVRLPLAPPASYPLPPRLERMVGRCKLVPMLATEVTAQRFVNIVGPGGIGKTTTAVAVAHTLRDDFDQAVCFFDLGALSAPELLASTMIATLGLNATGDPTQSLSAWLQDRKFLLVLDNCEHLIDAIAILAERLFRAAPRLCILATSREPMRVEGELVHRLLPLECPPAGQPLSAAEALAFPAVQLFVERVKASGHHFELQDADAPVVAEICRQLDGIALAIELGAGRVTAFGVRGTALLVNSNARLGWPGRRTALPRHQTLNTMLDWSYNLLPDFERKVLRRLAIFVGHFSLKAAIGVSCDGPQDQSQVITALDSLVAKSLASLETTPHGTGYRLLESTRVYVMEKLIATGETQLAAQRNAEQLVASLEESAVETAIFPTSRPSPRQLDYLGNLRACIDWCFSDAGDAVLGARLCAAGMPTLLQFSLLEECRHWSEIAIATLAGKQGCLRQEMVLQEALAISSMFMVGNSGSVLAAIERGLELARRLQDRRHELRLLAGLNIYRTRISDFFGSLAVAIESIAVARELNDPASLALAEWMLGVSYHLVGNQEAAQQHCETGMALIEAAGSVNTICFGYDHRIRAMAALTRALWLKGNREQAEEMAWQTITEAQQLDHPISYCIALIYAGPIFIWNGDWDTAEALIEQLITHAGKHMLGPYQAVGQGLKGQLLVARGQAGAGVALLRACLDTLRSGQHQILNTVFMASLAEGLLALGELQAAQQTIDQAAAAGGGTFSAPEIVRIKNMLAALGVATFG